MIKYISAKRYLNADLTKYEIENHSNAVSKNCYTTDWANFESVVKTAFAPYSSEYSYYEEIGYPGQWNPILVDSEGYISLSGELEHSYDIYEIVEKAFGIPEEIVAIYYIEEIDAVCMFTEE